MATTATPLLRVQAASTAASLNWVTHAALLWRRRFWLGRVTATAAVLGLILSLAIPKQYTAGARIMPPDQQGSGAMMLAALAGKTGALGGLGSLAGGLLGTHSSSALYVEMLRSGTVSGHLIERFGLQHVYRTRYNVDTAKRLTRRTTIAEDKKSGVITIEVQDTDPVRARDLAQGYLDELNKLLNQTSTSSARLERIFIERRLRSVEADLEAAQAGMSDFSSRNSTIDIGGQTRAMVDALAKLQAEMLIEQSGLNALKQIYGDGNVRVRETVARIASLQRELQKMSGTSAPLSVDIANGAPGLPGSEVATNDATKELYPPLRQLPRLAVPYANLYRRVRVQETLYELLTQQYELARIEEEKDVPVVSVMDAPGIPEKKSFPPRILLTLGITLFGFMGACAWVLMLHHWQLVDPTDARKQLFDEVLGPLKEKEATHATSSD